MNKISALWSLFRKGQSVSNPAAWKTGQITATALGAVIMAAIHVLNAFGVVLPVDESDCAAIAGGILVVVNIVLTITTTDKLGLPAKQPPMPADCAAQGTRITPSDVQAGIDFADKAAGQPNGRGQNVE
jgi:hypothetical protein